MHWALQTMLADTPLVKNMDNPDHMKILLDGKENIEELFAEIGKFLAEENDALLKNTDHILPGFRSLASLSSLPDKLVQALTGNRDAVKSN